MGLSLGKPHMFFYVNFSVGFTGRPMLDYSYVSYDIPLMVEIDGKSKEIKTLTIEKYTINEQQKPQFDTFDAAKAWAQSHRQDMIHEAKPKMEFWTDNYDPTVHTDL